MKAVRTAQGAEERDPLGRLKGTDRDACHDGDRDVPADPDATGQREYAEQDRLGRGRH